MLTSVLVVGSTRELAGPIDEYEKRAARYWRLEVTQIPEGKGREREEILSREAEGFRRRIRPGFVTAALTRTGDHSSSVDLARWMDKLAVRSVRGVHFLIGGAFGIDRGLLEECDRRLALSGMTLPHEFARLILAEQLYRAGTISRNEPYHKGPR